jgi:pimeloyl-ACP methyl ester carboxylesterase
MAAARQVAVVEEPEHDENIPLWRELFSAVDYCKLKTSGVYYGFGVPRGEGDPVVVVPGFLGNDLYLVELYLWLRRMGYNAYMSRIGHNAQCPDKLMHRLLRTVNRAYADTGRPVHLIGHSFGGVLSRGVATRKPERIASVITLGSPIKGVKVNPWVLWSIAQVRRRTHKRPLKGKDCYTDSCACGFLCTMNSSFPRRIPTTCVYTKSDGVVAWEYCLGDADEDNFEVSGTHVGLAWNHEVYELVAKRLAWAREERHEAALEEEARLLERRNKSTSSSMTGSKTARKAVERGKGGRRAASAGRKKVAGKTEGRATKTTSKKRSTSKQARA